MIPIPPAADTVPTSSGLLHGYMAPQMSGTRTRAWVVRLFTSPQQPVHRGPGDDVTRGIPHVGMDVVLRFAIHCGHVAATFRGERAARLLEVADRQAGDDPARAWRKRGEHRGPAGHLREVHQRDRVNRPQVIPDLPAVAQAPAGVSRSQLFDPRPYATRVRRHASDQDAEERAAEWESREPTPPERDRRAGGVERFRQCRSREKNRGRSTTAPDDNRLSELYGTSASVVPYLALITGISALASSRWTAREGWTPSSDMPVPNGAVALA